MLSFLIVLLFPVVVGIWLGVRIVPQGEEWVVERLGRFHRVLEPGPNVIFPVIDQVRNMVQTSLRSIIGGMDLNEALSSRDRIKTELKAAIADEAVDWGLTVKSVEIQDIKPSANMQQAMELQASAERERVALVTRSEGEKQAIILNAEARLEAARKDAEAQQVAAAASAESIRLITEAVKENNASATFLLGDRYIQAMHKLSASENAKLVLLPGDLVAAVKNLVGAK